MSGNGAADPSIGLAPESAGDAAHGVLEVDVADPLVLGDDEHVRRGGAAHSHGSAGFAHQKRHGAMAGEMSAALVFLHQHVDKPADMLGDRY